MYATLCHTLTVFAFKRTATRTLSQRKLRSSAMAAQNSAHPLWISSWNESAGERTIQKHSVNKGAPVRLFCSWFFPFAQRAWIALEEKGVEYEYVEINPYEVDPAEPGGYTKRALSLEKKRELYPQFMDASPRGLVPAIDHDGRGVWESHHAVAYLDEAFRNGTNLLPDDPLKRAHARIWGDHCNVRIVDAFYTQLMSQDEAKQTEGCERFFNECRMLARAMSTEGPFYAGKQFGFVDIALAPFWQRFLWVGEHYRGLKMPQGEPDFDRLAAWWEATSQRPSVAATMVCKARLISSYSHYAQNKGTTDFATQMQSKLGTKSA